MSLTKWERDLSAWIFLFARIGGLYSCFRAAKDNRCLVLSVDTPLVPCAALAKLCKAHINGITLLRHSGKAEPLIGVYDTALESMILPLIKTQGASARALYHSAVPAYFDYTGPEEFLLNCNAPQQFSEAFKDCTGLRPFSPAYIIFVKPTGPRNFRDSVGFRESKKVSGLILYSSQSLRRSSQFWSTSFWVSSIIHSLPGLNM